MQHACVGEHTVLYALLCERALHICRLAPICHACVVFVQAELLDGPRHCSTACNGASLPPAGAAAGGAGAVLSGLSWIDRLLPVWIVGAMVIGVLLGSFAPQVSP